MNERVHVDPAEFGIVAAPQEDVAVPRIFTSFGARPIPPCAQAFYKGAKGLRRDSKIARKWQRYYRFVDMVSVKDYQNGVDIFRTPAPSWGEFDLLDLKTR